MLTRPMMRFAVVSAARGWTCPRCHTHWRVMMRFKDLTFVRVEPVGAWSAETACDDCRPHVLRRLEREGRPAHPGVRLP